MDSGFCHTFGAYENAHSPLQRAPLGAAELRISLSTLMDHLSRVQRSLCIIPRPSEGHQEAGTVVTATPQVWKQHGGSLRHIAKGTHGRRGLKPKLQPWQGLLLDHSAAAGSHLVSPHLLGSSCYQTQPCSVPAVEGSRVEALKYRIPVRDLGMPLCRKPFPWAQILYSGWAHHEFLFSSLLEKPPWQMCSRVRISGHTSHFHT